MIEEKAVKFYLVGMTQAIQLWKLVVDDANMGSQKSGLINTQNTHQGGASVFCFTPLILWVTAEGHTLCLLALKL